MSTNKISTKTYISACRICLTSECLNSVLLNEQNGWLGLFEYCFGLLLTTEDVPRILCTQCADNVKMYSKFKDQCLKSDTFWKSVIFNAKCCIEKENNIFDNEVKKEDLEDDTQNVNECDNTNDDSFDKSFNNYSDIFNYQEIKKDVVFYEPISFEGINSDNLNNVGVDSQSKQYCIEDKTENSTNSVKAKEKKNHTCEKCRKKFEKKKCFLKHVNICKSKKRTSHTSYSSSHRMHDFSCGKKNDGKIVNTSNSDARIRNKLQSDICMEHDMKPRLLNNLEVDALEKDGTENNENTLFHCGMCVHTSSSEIDVCKHLDQHWSNNDLSCNLCDFVGVDLAAIFSHRYAHYPSKHETRFLCHICRKRKLSLLALHFHYREVHLKKNGGFCSKCNREFPKLRSWKKHESTHINGGFICDICGKRYLYKHLIIEHMLVHMDPQRFVCDACGKIFTRSRYLKLHIRGVHAKTGPRKCSHCNRIFKSEHTLKVHQQIYASKKTAKCEVCCKVFPSKSLLKSHMAMHSDERPYCCYICGSSYKAKGSLKVHMRRHTGDLPHKCEQCGKCFPTPRRLRLHGATHSRERAHACPRPH